MFPSHDHGGHDPNSTQMTNQSNSGDGLTYYTFSYALQGTLSIFEATQDTTYLDRVLTWCENMVARATIIDYAGYKNWGGTWGSPWASQDISFHLYDAQGMHEISRCARVILTNSDLRATYESRAIALYEFVRDHHHEKWLVQRNAESWHRTLAADTTEWWRDVTSMVISSMVELMWCNDYLGYNDRVQND